MTVTFHFSASGIATFRKIMDFLNFKDFLQDVNLVFKEEGMYIQSMDEYHVCLVNIQLDKKVCKTYKLTKPNLSLGINLDSICKILKCTGSSDTTFSYNEIKNVMVIKVYEGSKVKSKFELRLISKDDEVVSIPKLLDYSNINVLAFDQISKACSDLLVFTSPEDDLIISANGTNELSFKSSGDTISAEIIVETTSKARNQCKVNVSLKYIQWFTKISSMEITLSIDKNHPILWESQDDCIKCAFFLASKN